jgi:hypothetical protein
LDAEVFEWIEFMRGQNVQISGELLKVCFLKDRFSDQKQGW